MLPDICKAENRKKTVLLSACFVMIMFLIVIAIFVTFVWLLVSQNEIIDWIQDLGFWGNVIFGAIIAILNLPFMIGYAFALMICGFLYGFWRGLLTAILGSFCGWFPTFLVIRYSLYDKASRVRNNKN